MTNVISFLFKMLKRLNTHEQVAEIHYQLSLETNWYWWVEGAYPSYPKFENWIQGCEKDQIGILGCYTQQLNQTKLFGFIKFNNTSTLHQFTYLTVWISPEFRQTKNLMPFGALATYTAIEFAFNNFNLTRIYFNIVDDNKDSINPIKKIANYESTIKDYYFLNGKFCNLLTFSVNKSKWNIIKQKYSDFLKNHITL